MEGKVLIVEPRPLVRRAATSVFVRRGYQVLAVDSAEVALRLPHHFHCGVFSDTLPDANAISLVGWFLVEQRVECVVFFGGSRDVDLRLRASNLGTFVGHAEGLHQLERAVRNALADQWRLRRVVGGGSLRLCAHSDSEIRRRVVI